MCIHLDMETERGGGSTDLLTLVLTTARISNMSFSGVLLSFVRTKTHRWGTFPLAKLKAPARASKVLPQPRGARLVRIRAFHLRSRHHGERVLPVGSLVRRRRVRLPRAPGPRAGEGALRQARRCRCRPGALSIRYAKNRFAGGLISAQLYSCAC